MADLASLTKQLMKENDEGSESTSRRQSRTGRRSDVASSIARMMKEKAGGVVGSKATGRGRSGAKDSKPAAFFVTVNGELQSGQLGGTSDVYCRYIFDCGPDWQILQGVESGVTQQAQLGSHCSSDLVWNFPIDISFKSTNPFGWPRIVVSAYEIDFFGRDVIAGYGSTYLPTTGGQHTLRISMFKPASSTLAQKIIAFFKGSEPEFFDSRFVARGEDREVTRVECTGVVTIRVNILTRGMKLHGYSVADDGC